MLILPAIREVSVREVSGGNIVSWCSASNLGYRCVGYNVYRFEKSAFISQRPSRTISADIFEYRDIHRSTQRKTICYLVRMLFEVDKTVVEGPASRIVCV